MEIIFRLDVGENRLITGYIFLIVSGYENCPWERKQRGSPAAVRYAASWKRECRSSACPLRRQPLRNRDRRSFRFQWDRHAAGAENQAAGLLREKYNPSMKGTAGAGLNWMSQWIPAAPYLSR